MPRFTVKDLLIATTLVAVGLAMYCMLPALNDTPFEKVGFWYTFVSLGLIGAGLGTPFHRPWKGAITFVIVALISM